ncbi:MAG: cation transporter [Chitinophagales bacterium]|nr:MAG: cation transporter [Chitinophagales bacterium]
MKRNLERLTVVIAIVTLIIGVCAGYFLGKSSRPKTESAANQPTGQTDNQIWTCAMHPQIRSNGPGKCPICGMDLVPLNQTDAGDSLAIRMSPTAMKLADVQTTVVTMQQPVKEVRLNGKVHPDERMVVSQSSHIPGRVEQLLVNFTGEFIQKGQTIAVIYSPDLVTAQEELLIARKLKETQPALYEAAREKLKNWKLTDKQIDAIENSGRKQENFPVVADVSGVVISKQVKLGDYILRGQTIYQIADLSKVWVLFDVYESDLPWVKKGDKVEFTIPSLPGEQFSGTITFIDPVIHPKTRVASARVEIANPGMKLKPEMFASGRVSSILKTEPAAVIIPRTAVLWTGERSLVYVKQTTDKGIHFIMREVVLGPSVKDGYIVKSGLHAGEEIATKGTFSIDAAAQLAGKKSMMNPEGGKVTTGHDHGAMNTPAENSQADKSAEMRMEQNKQAHLNFKVSGNCAMCKARIEGALKNVDGIYSAAWDVDTKMLHVMYDPEKISEMEIHKRIAAVGHDTEKVKAEEKVYNALPGCCQYTREN